MGDWDIANSAGDDWAVVSHGVDAVKSLAPPGVKSPIPPVGTLPPAIQQDAPLGGKVTGYDEDPMSRFMTASMANVADANPVSSNNWYGAKPALRMSAPGLAYQGMQNAYQQYQDRNKPMTFDRVVGKLGEQIGLNPDKIRNSALSGDIPSVLAEGTVPILTTLLAGKLGKSAPAAADLPVTAVERQAGVRQIADAVNVPAKVSGKFEADLGTHMNKIAQFAADNDIPLNSRQNIATAMKGASNAQRATYYNEVLQPHGDVMVGTTDIPGYSGKGFGEGARPSMATLKQLDSRLTEINAELSPKYAKGGMAAQASLKTQPELMAEASAIRKNLYGKLGELTGNDPQGIGSLRASFGALDDLAEKAGMAARKERFAANVTNQKPLSVNPFAIDKEFIADRFLKSVGKNKVGNAIETGARPFYPPKLDINP